jgi:sugar phosphate isomerase/epimerase
VRRRDLISATVVRVQLGFLTACFPDLTLDQIAAWASANGFEFLEIAAWPVSAERRYAANHVDVDGFGPGDAERVAALLADHDLTVSSLAFYENNLHPDPGERERINAHVQQCVDAAALLAVRRLDVRRPGPATIGARQLARRRAGVPPAGGPRWRAWGDARDRELPHADLAP